MQLLSLLLFLNSGVHTLVHHSVIVLEVAPGSLNYPRNLPIGQSIPANTVYTNAERRIPPISTNLNPYKNFRDFLPRAV